MCEPVYKIKANAIYVQKDKNTLFDQDVQFFKSSINEVLCEFGNHRFELDQMKDKHLFEVSDQVDQGILIAARSGDKYCISFEKKSDFLDTIDWLKNCIARAGSTRG